MTVTAAAFRDAFKAFSDESEYPADAVTFWLGIAGKMLSAEVWDADIYDLGIQLFISHHLILEKNATKASEAGGTPSTSGAVSSRSAAGVSVSYDTSSSIEMDAGHWNLTSYGTRFIRLARMQGAVGLQL